MVIKKDGSMVTMEQFMNDSQQAMNAQYRKSFGLSAPAADMNLVTSAHPEAFSTPKLLDHNVDFSTLNAEEIARAGKVLKVKMAGINKNKMMTNTIKMQTRFKRIGMEETNPMEIINMNRVIMHQTGGRDINGLINDLTRMF